jgi:hypothetical protein
MSAQVLRLFDVLPAADQAFVRFWYLYPKRLAKFDALRAWSRLSAADREAALAALPAHVAHWQLSGTERRFVPHPATWLRQRRWEDELQDLDAPLTDLGQCEWNRNNNRDPGQPRCGEPAKASNDIGHVYCAEHARKLGLKVGR